VARRPAFGWAGQYLGTSAGVATLARQGFPYVPLGVLIEVLGWAVLAALFLGWLRPRRRTGREEDL